MDAAHTYFGRTVLFLAIALLMVIPGYAQVTPAFNLNSSNSNSVTVSPTPSSAAVVSVAGTEADGVTPITFAASVVSYAAGDPSWLSVTASGPLRTPVTLYFQIGAQAGQLQPGLHTAAVTLTDTNGSGAPAARITITYYPNAANSGNGTVIPSSASLVLSAASGSSTSTTITLTTTSTTSVAFITPATPSSGNSTWLTATANTYTVSSATYAVLTIVRPVVSTIAQRSTRGCVLVDAPRMSRFGNLRSNQGARENACREAILRPMRGPGGPPHQAGVSAKGWVKEIPQR